MEEICRGVAAAETDKRIRAPLNENKAHKLAGVVAKPVFKPHYHSLTQTKGDSRDD